MVDQHFANRFGTHASVEFVAVLLDRVEIHFIGHQLAALQRRHARLDDNKRFEIQDPLDFAERHVEHQADT